jgi:tRNA-specific 2-thiouridylase
VPMFVVAIRPEDRAVVIGPREELLGRGVIARGMNWLVDAPAVGASVEIQVRHRSSPARAEIVRLEGDEIEVALDESVSAIAPGQSLVIYDGDRVLGGGLIERATGKRAPLPVRAA